MGVIGVIGVIGGRRESVRLRDTVLAYFDMQIRASHSACSKYDQHV